MEEFAKKLQDFKADLLVVGGLQMMDNFPFQSGKSTPVSQCGPGFSVCPIVVIGISQNTLKDCLQFGKNVNLDSLI